MKKRRLIRLSQKEYSFMRLKCEGLHQHEVLKIADECFEAGWIDAVGVVTAKGEEAIRTYIDRCLR